MVNPLSGNPTNWSNKSKQFVGKLPTNCLNVFDHFVGLALKVLRIKAPERCQRRHSVVVIVNLELYSHTVLEFPLLT